MTSVVWEMARKRGTEGKIGQINPLKRGGVSDEIARVALFLGSDELVVPSFQLPVRAPFRKTAPPGEVLEC